MALQRPGLDHIFIRLGPVPPPHSAVTGYCHIGSQRGGVPTQVRTSRLDSERGVGGPVPN